MKRLLTIAFVLILTMILNSCEDILFEEDLSLSTLNIIAPKDNTIVRASTIVFNWTKVQGATSYQLQIATPNFAEASQIVIDTKVDGTTYTEDLPKNNYEWRVRAFNSGYNGIYTNAHFKVEDNADFSSTRVSLISPENNFISNKVNNLLEWRTIQNATAYRIQIKKDDSLISEEITTENSLNYEFPEGEFLWKVRAENESQITLYSERKIIIDTVSPKAPKLVKPINNSSLNSPNIIFEWKNDDIDESKEIDSLFVYKDVTLENNVFKKQVNISYNTILDRNTTFYWYMVSYDEAGNKSDKSEVFSFTIN